MALQGINIDGMLQNPDRIVGLQSFQHNRVDTSHALAFENCPVPCLVAAQAPIDEPSVKHFAVGVQAKLVADLKGLRPPHPLHTIHG
jgi:hypothetical protein